MPQPPFYRTLGMPFIELSSIDSTNNYALTQIHEGLARHGMAFFAHEQVAGKGQRNKSWTTEKETSLIISIVLDPSPLQLAQQFQLSACVAASACEFLDKYDGRKTCIKWPNDLYWHDRKAGGILIENVIGSGKTGTNGIPVWRWAVVGVGININQVAFPPELRNPISLKQLTGKEFNTVELAKEFCTVFNKNFQHLVQGGFADIYNFYIEHLYQKNRLVKLKKGSRVFEATIKTVTPGGRLVVQHALEEEFDFGSVEWVIPSLSAK
ncbi:biotin--[acetyl-CoA-carboxylase] ligase [Terrimonas pollutisoli]|uniref:biotin--[acetyl-CoA-carboxylase] ligase n=1 Tax=Terrimonas pollutisoli TaxID=3034147 RepID=UPI0023EC1FBC|nr:biotin--[acetyl-CoA-carboxylase] ligase [Terrimonas sp. H1YJ31]